MGDQRKSQKWKTGLIFGSLIVSNIAFAAASTSAPRWGLQRIVQREPLTAEDITSGVKIFDLKTVSTTKRVNIYIIDSGVRIEHQEFAGNRAEYGVNIRNPGSLPSDCDGHGTHVAALAVGAFSGVATKAHAIAVRILDCNGRGSCSDILSALEYVLSDSEQRRKAGQRSVAVLSVGSVNSACSSSLDVSQELWDKGVIVAAAAGNNNSDACSLYPARNPGTIAVGATSIQDRVYDKNNYGDCIDCFAPGVAVLSAWGKEDGPEWKERTGSSMAAPVVAGISAIILGTLPELTAAEVRQIIISSSSRNRILTPTGNQIMSSSVNRLVYAPWSRLFEDIDMNGNFVASESEQETVLRQSLEEGNPDWNSSASIIALSMTLQPKTIPAMAYSVTRIMSALSSAAGVRLPSILVRRVAGVQILENGKEPSAVPLVFYFPTLPSITMEYKRRLVEADKKGYLIDASGETFSFAQGSLETAILMNVTVPPKANSDQAFDGDRVNVEESKGIGTGVVIALISVGAIVAAAMLIVIAVLVIMPRAARARERREALDEMRRHNSVRMGPYEAAGAASAEDEV